MTLERRLAKLEVLAAAIRVDAEPDPEREAYHARSKTCLAAALAEILGLDELTVDELLGLLEGAGLGGPVRSGPDPARQVAQRAREFLAAELGISVDAVTYELAARVLRGEEVDGDGPKAAD